MFHSSALAEYLRLYNKVNKCKCVKYEILLTANMFRNILAVSNMWEKVFYTCEFVGFIK